MSAAGMRCPACGSTNIVDDDLYSQAQLVCVDCGSVVSEGVLANDPVGGSGTKMRLKSSLSRQQRVKAICRILMVNREIEDLSQTYYKMAYEHKAFLKVSLQKKEILTGCCVLLSCRQLNWPITVGTISCLLDADSMAVGAIYQEMVKNLSIEAPIINVTDVIEAHCHEYKISSLDVPEELAENSRDLTKRAVALVELAADSWIVTGRKPIPIMMAATYLAWQSLKPNKHRLKFSLDKFCQVAKVKKLKSAMKRVAEIKEVLCKLGKEIPWVRETVTPDNVIQLVECILQNRYALLRRAMRTHEDTPITSFVKQNGSNSDGKEKPGDVDYNPRVLPEHSDTQESQNPPPNWGKRVLFAPPCVINAKKRRAVQPEHTDVTGDEEISDSEIDSYIRTPQEARDFALMHPVTGSSEMAGIFKFMCTFFFFL
uniref:Transcription factor IIIB 50 kDa subunit n=1 Tax=Maylandia zebra TaxID=106582 RepID=A0A3P9CQ14_9CICH